MSGEADKVAEVQKAIGETEERINKTLEKYEGQVEEAKSVSQEVRQELDKLSKQHQELSDEESGAMEKLRGVEEQLTELEQKVLSKATGRNENTETLGERVVNSEMFKQFSEGGQPRMRLELKNTDILGSTAEYKNTVSGESGSPAEPDDVLTPRDRLPGIVEGAFRSLRVLDFMPMGRTVSNMVEYTREKTFTNQAAETSETGTKSESTLEFELANAPVRTIAHIIKVTRQVMEDAPALSSYIDRRMRYGVDLRLEQQIVAGNGTSPNIAGILDSNNHTAFTAVSGDNLIDSLNKIKYDVIGADYEPTAYWMNPADWSALELLKRNPGTDDAYVAASVAGMTYLRNGLLPMIWGVPVILSNSVTSGKIICGAWQIATMLMRRSGTVVEIFEQDSDNVQKNLLTVRAEQRAALPVFRPASIYAGDGTI